MATKLRSDREIDTIVDDFEQGSLVVQHADFWTGQDFDLAKRF